LSSLFQGKYHFVRNNNKNNKNTYVCRSLAAAVLVAPPLLIWHVLTIRQIMLRAHRMKMIRILRVCSFGAVVPLALAQLARPEDAAVAQQFPLKYAVVLCVADLVG
jgi:hypothetical protein